MHAPLPTIHQGDGGGDWRMNQEQLYLLHAQKLAFEAEAKRPAQPKAIVLPVEAEPRPELLALRRVPGQRLH
jgi:hypothetical protein